MKIEELKELIKARSHNVQMELHDFLKEILDYHHLPNSEKPSVETGNPDYFGLGDGPGSLSHRR